MLVLCHGRHHQRILSQWRDKYHILYVDEDAKCKPHLVLNILSQLHLLVPYGPFDAVAFIHAPFHVFANPDVCSVVPRLLKPEGVVLFHTETVNIDYMRCKNCDWHDYGIFSLEATQYLYSSHVVQHSRLL